MTFSTARFESEHLGERTFVTYYRWLPQEGAVRGIVQIAHGMAEHGRRYDGTARFLTGRGYAVYADDHRGHGASVLPGEPRGFFAARDGWTAATDDLHRLSTIARAEHPGVPLFLFGHSMGSFLSRAYAIRYGAELDGLVIAGTAGPPRLWERIGIRLIIALRTLLGGIRRPCPFLYRITLEPYNRPFRAPGLDSDYLWLSRDPAAVREFDEDPLCGGIFPLAFFRDIADGIVLMSDPDRIAAMPKDLPVLIASGGDDPVGRFGAAVRQVEALFRAAGMREVTLRIYPGARHELHNETNREEFLADLAAWLEARTAKTCK